MSNKLNLEPLENELSKKINKLVKISIAKHLDTIHAAIPPRECEKPSRHGTSWTSDERNTLRESFALFLKHEAIRRKRTTRAVVWELNEVFEHFKHTEV